MGPREKDALRALPGLIQNQSEIILELREDNRIMKELLRSIKKSIVRKYGEAKGEEVSENV